MDRKDRVGVALAAACFVHCVAGPALLLAAGFAGLIGTSEKIEPWFLAGSLLLGIASLLPSYRNKHKRLICVGLFSAGMLCLALRRWAGTGAFALESIASGTGACLIAGAHILNVRLSRRCQCCEAPETATNLEVPERSEPDVCSQ